MTDEEKKQKEAEEKAKQEAEEAKAKAEAEAKAKKEAEAKAKKEAEEKAKKEEAEQKAKQEANDAKIAEIEANYKKSLEDYKRECDNKIAENVSAYKKQISARDDIIAQLMNGDKVDDDADAIVDPINKRRTAQSKKW